MHYFNKKTTNLSQEQRLVTGTSVPLIIRLENRSGYRVSFTKKGVVIRISKWLPKWAQNKQISSCEQWALQMMKKKPQLAKNYQIKEFKDGQIISCFDQNYTIQIQQKQRKTIQGKVKNEILEFSIPSHEKIEKKHISQVLAKHYKPYFENRTRYWSECFPVQYKTLRLKYNTSNWGSCSNKKNINLSTRLFLCPLPAIDYVIVHELAHLIHHNHSKKFWAEVERIMPDYKVQERWFKTEGAHLDF